MASIQIEIIDVSVQVQGKYKKMSVAHKIFFGGQAKTDSKALVDFATPPDVWNKLESAQKGDRFVIEREKDKKEGKYWEWLSIARDDGEEPVSQAPVKSNFSDREDSRQKHIIRQSCLKAAVDLGIANNIGSDGILDIAKKFEEWVNRETE